MKSLRSLLDSHGVPQARLAQAAGICPTQLSRWMTGRVTPSPDSVARLSEVLDRVVYGG